MKIKKISVHNTTVGFDGRSLYIPKVGILNCSTIFYVRYYGSICYCGKIVEFGDKYGDCIYGMTK